MSGYGLIQIYPPQGAPYDFGTVVSITDSLNKGISVTEIVSLPTDCTFAIESQTSNSYTINFIRRNPYKSDGSTYEDDGMYKTTSWMWTNERWVRGTSSLINRWQAQSDGYVMHLNVARDIYGTPLHKVDENGQFTDELVEYNGLFPVTVRNVYLKSITYAYSAGDTDTISGRLEIVVGGKMTYKAATSTGNKVVNYRLYVLERGLKHLADNHTDGLAYTPLYSAGPRCYNACNEYQEYITKADKLVTITYLESGVIKEVPVLKGTNMTENEDDTYDEFNAAAYEDELNYATTYTIRGGPSYPFESIELSVNMNMISANHSEVYDDPKEGKVQEQEKYKIVPGVSEIYAKAVGSGKYVVTEYKSSESKMTLKGYCHAAILTALTWPDDLRTITAAPNAVILSVLTTPNYGLDSPYTYDRIITNIMTNGNFDNTKIVVKSGANLWQVLGTIAMFCKARIFFTSERVFVIDYTQISKYPDRFTESVTSSDYTGGNRLWIRDGIDIGETPTNEWADATAGLGTEAANALRYSLDSLELHSSRIESRIGGRVNGTVRCPTTSDQTVINSIVVKYAQTESENGKEVTKQHTFKVGPYVNATETIDYYGEIYDDEISTRADGSADSAEYSEIRARGRKCYEDIGTSEEILDLTSLFESVSTDVVRAYAYSMLAYHLEPLIEVNFKVAENYPPQSAANIDSDDQIKYAFWSPIFPKVCAVKRFTDVDQKLEVSSLGRYDKNPTYRSEKTYLTSYEYSYPEQQTEYTFGEVTPISLANNTTKTNVLIQNR